MLELGKKDEIFGADLLKALQLSGKPTTMPTLGENEKVICGFDQGLGERMIVCDNLEEMQMLYDKYAMGYAVRINWYKGEDLGFVTVIAET